MLRAALLGLAFLGLTTVQASAHARLLHATPRVGSTVRVGPRELVLQFSESIDLKASTVTVTGPTGRVAERPLELDRGDPRRVHVPLEVALPAGSYSVEWGITSADTHHTDGDFTFRVAR